jgi:hypothetical protein
VAVVILVHTWVDETQTCAKVGTERKNAPLEMAERRGLTKSTNEGRCKEKRADEPRLTLTHLRKDSLCFERCRVLNHLPYNVNALAPLLLECLDVFLRELLLLLASFVRHFEVAVMLGRRTTGLPHSCGSCDLDGLCLLLQLDHGELAFARFEGHSVREPNEARQIERQPSHL